MMQFIYEPEYIGDPAKQGRRIGEALNRARQHEQFIQTQVTQAQRTEDQLREDLEAAEAEETQLEKEIFQDQKQLDETPEETDT